MIKGKLQIVYVGIISEVRLIHKVLDAAKDLNVEIHICGNFDSKKYEDKIKKHPSWTKVKYYGYVDNIEKIKDIFNKADLSLVPLKPIENYKTSLPVKLFEYMHYGKYVIAQDFVIIKKILKKYNCGMLIDFQNTNQIIDAFNFVANNINEIKEKGLNGINAVNAEYNWKYESTRLVNFYKDTYNSKKKLSIVKKNFSFFYLVINFFLKFLKNTNLRNIYLAGGLSFLFVLIRDFYIINYTSQSGLFFSVIYILTISCGFGINGITLSKNLAMPKNVLVISLLSILGLLVVYLFNNNIFMNSLILFFYLSSIAILWIIGAMISRNIMDSNYNYLIARSRETITTIIFILSLIIGFEFFFGFLASVFFGTFFLFVYMLSKQKNYLKTLINNFFKRTDSGRFLSKNILFANLAVIGINLWALSISNVNISYYGISSVTLARISTYIFQIVTLGTLYFSLKIYLYNNYFGFYKILFIIFGIISYISYESIYHFLFFPLTLALLHYYFIYLISQDISVD